MLVMYLTAPSGGQLKWLKYQNNCLDVNAFNCNSHTRALAHAHAHARMRIFSFIWEDQMRGSSSDITKRDWKINSRFFKTCAVKTKLRFFIPKFVHCLVLKVLMRVLQLSEDNAIFFLWKKKNAISQLFLRCFLARETGVPPWYVRKLNEFSLSKEDHSITVLTAETKMVLKRLNPKSWL